MKDLMLIKKEERVMKATRFIIPVILLASACQQVEIESPDNKETSETEIVEGVYTITIQATKDEGETKALDLVTGTPDHLDAYWKNTEKVKVYKDGTLLGTLNVTPGSGSKPASATLSGPITTAGLVPGDVLMLRIPGENWDYSGQVGTLSSIEATYDYAIASVTIDTVDDLNYTITTTGTASFQNQQSVYRFGFKLSGNYIDPKAFTVSASGGKLVQSLSWNGSAWAPLYGNIGVTPASAPGDHFYYVSLRNDQTTDDTYNFIVTGSDDALYMGSKAIPAGALGTPGKFISVKNISVSQPSFTPASGSVDDPAEVL